MSEWREYKLGDVAEITSSKRIFFSDYVSSGIPFYRSKEIIEKANGGDISTELFITKEKFLEIKERFGSPSDGDLLIAAVGERSGVPYLVDNDGDFYFKDGNLIWFRNFKAHFSSEFLSYYFKSYIGQQKLEATMIGSAQKALTIVGLKNLEVTFPPYLEQQVIAESLSCLDDKISLLHQQNKTLERLAETLFRQWLVEEAEADWKETSLFNVVELVGGGTPKTEIAEYWDGNIKWISAKDITSNHKRFIIDTEKEITEQGLINSSAKIMPKYSTIISARGTVGNYCLLSESMAFSQSNYGIKPRFKDCYFFTYLVVANSVKELQNAAYGSVFDTITTNTFKEQKIKIPTEEVIQQFELDIKPHFEKMLSNSKQIRTLTKLRNTLLPKLMSGAASVSLG